MRRIAATVVTLGLALASIAIDPASAQPHGSSPPVPKAIAATGDSITRAFNVGFCCVLQDTPSRSWSTGTDATVRSHYLRLTQLDDRISGNAYNNARSGATMRDLAGQMATSASQRAGYVTVMMGANDVCASSASTMTPTTTFEAGFRAGLGQLTAARPQAKVFVASIPDIHRLWELFSGNALAVTIWKLFGICQSMLSPSLDPAARQVAVERLQDFNDILARVCAEFRQCRWDGYAVYETEFVAGDVSPVDFFHPSTAGQAKLAAVTWAASYWGAAG